MAEIRVAGTGTASAPAEHADVQLRVALTAPSADEVLRTTGEVYQRIVDRAKDLVEDGTAATWFADRIVTSSSREWTGDGQEPRTVFHANANVRVRIVRLEALGAVLGELGVVEGVQVDNVQYGHADATATRLATEARTGAVHDAVARARDYAAAAGLADSTIVAIDESLEDRPMPRMEMMMARGAAMASAPVFDMNLDDLTTTTTVRITFDAPSPTTA